MWQLSFVAMSLAIGESLDDALAALGNDSVSASPFVASARSSSRDTRARALAEQLAPIAAAIEALEVTWPA
jgi:hypothetical protein